MHSGAAPGTRRPTLVRGAQSARPAQSRWIHTLTLISVKFTILLYCVMSKILKKRPKSPSGFRQREGPVKAVATQEAMAGRPSRMSECAAAHTSRGLVALQRGVEREEDTEGCRWILNTGPEGL